MILISYLLYLLPCDDTWYSLLLHSLLISIAPHNPSIRVNLLATDRLRKHHIKQ